MHNLPQNMIHNDKPTYVTSYVYLEATAGYSGVTSVVNYIYMYMCDMKKKHANIYNHVRIYIYIYM
jgi:hypothetical protein